MDDFWYSPVSGPSSAGLAVSEDSSLQCSAVWACVSIIARAVGALPFHLYERTGERSHTPATSHALYGLLHDQANFLMTAQVFRETLTQHVLLWGNGYAYIDWTSRGTPRALWPLRPDMVEPRLENGRLLYRCTFSSGDYSSMNFRNMIPIPGQKGFQADLDPADVLHIPGMGFNGITGYSVIGKMRNVIGLAMAAENYAARLFANDARPSVVIEHPGVLKKDARDNLGKSWRANYGGSDKAGGTAVLEEGMKVKEVGFPPKDALWIESRKFSVIEICRWFHVPPHMVAELERSTNNNIEHQGIEFVVHTLMPWLVRWEQGTGLRLISQTGRYFAKLNVSGLLRGSIKDRTDAYRAFVDMGALNPNEVRELEDWNPYDGGDEYRRQVNTQPVGAVGGGKNE